MLRTKSALKQQQFVAVAEAAAGADDNDAVVGGGVDAADETLSTTYLLLMGMAMVMVVERQYNNILWIRTRPGCRYIIRNHTHNSSTTLRRWEYLFVVPRATSTKLYQQQRLYATRTRLKYIT